MKRAVCFLLATPLAAHMVSMSTGDAAIEGNSLRFELRMPLYEVAHVRDPERALLAALTFTSRGVDGKLIRSACRQEAPQGSYFCEAVYEFPDPVERLRVASRLHSITVPNHVHLLRASRGASNDQAVIDLSFPTAELRFRPPTPRELAMQQFLAGALRAAGGAAPLLFVAALVLAARSRRELLALGAAFLLGEIAACVAVSMSGWRPAPRFIEAAAALTIAYLAVEILLLPKAGHRWAVVGGLGVFHGLYFAAFLEASGYEPGWVLAGVAVAEAALIAAFALIGSRVVRALDSPRPAQGAAAVLMAVGMVWFFVRLRG